MFKKAIRRNTKIKLALSGAAGSGKTYSALRLATGLAETGRIAVIDTENGSASLYSDTFNFDVTSIEPPYTQDKFVQAIQEAVKMKYDVLVLDSGSHAWEGILEFKDMLDKRGGNSFMNWGEANRQYKLILNSLLHSNIHLIACLRSKSDYAMEQDNKGKTVPKKVGLAPIMRDGVEYEFTSVFNLDASHQAMAGKDRTGLFTDKIFQITEDTGRTIANWLKGGKDNTTAIDQEFETLGAKLYGGAWIDKKKELILHVTYGEHDSEERLTMHQMNKLIKGMKSKHQSEVNGVSS